DAGKGREDRLEWPEARQTKASEQAAHCDDGKFNKGIGPAQPITMEQIEKLCDMKICTRPPLFLPIRCFELVAPVSGEAGLRGASNEDDPIGDELTKARVRGVECLMKAEAWNCSVRPIVVHPAFFALAIRNPGRFGAEDTGHFPTETGDFFAA